MRRSIAVLILASAAALPATARGDGLPVVGVEAGGSGTTTAGERFVAAPARRATMVLRIGRAGGQVLRTRLVEGSYSVPAVALDGSAAGASANGRRLVLIKPRSDFPRTTTPLLVLDARRLRVRAHVRLRGDFSFDAISPDGATMFLVHYLSRTDPTRYEVRAFDLRRMRLRPGAIVDPHEPGEAMRGLPLTRTTSPDGRWAYTLYDGASAHPFVHALDTAGGGARCIDLDALAQHPRLYELRLALTGGELAVLDGAKRVARIDTATFRVGGPATAATAPKNRDPGAPVPAVIALGLLALAALARVAIRRRGPGANRSREDAERATRAPS